MSIWFCFWSMELRALYIRCNFGTAVPSDLLLFCAALWCSSLPLAFLGTFICCFFSQSIFIFDSYCYFIPVCTVVRILWYCPSYCSGTGDIWRRLVSADALSLSNSSCRTNEPAEKLSCHTLFSWILFDLPEERFDLWHWTSVGNHCRYFLWQSPAKTTEIKWCKFLSYSIRWFRP